MTDGQLVAFALGAFALVEAAQLEVVLGGVEGALEQDRRKGSTPRSLILVWPCH